MDGMMNKDIKLKLQLILDDIGRGGQVAKSGQSLQRIGLSVPLKLRHFATRPIYRVVPVFSQNNGDGGAVFKGRSSFMGFTSRAS